MKLTSIDCVWRFHRWVGRASLGIAKVQGSTLCGRGCGVHRSFSQRYAPSMPYIFMWACQPLFQASKPLLT